MLDDPPPLARGPGGYPAALSAMSQRVPGVSRQNAAIDTIESLFVLSALKDPLASELMVAVPTPGSRPKPLFSDTKGTDPKLNQAKLVRRSVRNFKFKITKTLATDFSKRSPTPPPENWPPRFHSQISLRPIPRTAVKLSVPIFNFGRFSESFQF